MARTRETHIIGCYPGETLCEQKIKKGMTVVKYPDHPADCPQCLIIWHEDQENGIIQVPYEEQTDQEENRITKIPTDQDGNPLEYVIHNDRTDNHPTQEELDSNLDRFQHTLAQKEARRGKGRPKKEVTRETIKPIRWTAEQWAEVEAAAETAGMKPSAFVRSAVLNQARQIATPAKPGSALAAARTRRK